MTGTIGFLCNIARMVNQIEIITFTSGHRVRSTTTIKGVGSITT